MQMPPSFAEILKAMPLDELKELLEWNEDSKYNRTAIALIKAEIESRED